MTPPRESPSGDAARLGEFLGPYKILGLLGAGGMGEVYRAFDARLGRDVAVKVLPADSGSDPDRLRRFEQEARAVAALSHPNVVSIHDVGSSNGIAFAVMELLDGETLSSRLARGVLPVQTSVDYGVQIAQGLSAAHNRGILHRDLKPDNVFVTTDGRVKIFDFGLAKLIPALDDGANSHEPTASEITGAGTVLGTVGYMSPEQVRGMPTDHRSDIFSFGAVLYEMLSGIRAFRGQTAADTMTAILTAEPPSLPNLGKTIAPALDKVVRHCLEKDPHQRFQSAQDIAFALQDVSAQRAKKGSAEAWLRALNGRARRATVLGGVLFLVFVGLVLLIVRHRRASESETSRGEPRRTERWALESAVPEISQLVDAGDFVKAAALSREARAILPKHPTLEKLWVQATQEALVASEPTGAEVSIRPYPGDPNAWEHLGNTPLNAVRVAKYSYIWRVAKPGFVPTFFIDGSASMPPASFNRIEWTITLHPEGSVPAEMVVVPGGPVSLPYPVIEAPEVEIGDYLIDRHEVVNAEYQRFVDAGGYARREFWKQPFVLGGHVVPWEQAVGRFRDATGRPGPATWEASHFPNGLENHPVAGVSWYEAAAYAEFVGKGLPTIYHWTNASQSDDFTALIASGSNFQGVGTKSVGAPDALSGFGTTDMAGNVKEWCSNEYRDGKRFIMGGGFGEPLYMFRQADAQPPWDRRANYGFRCIKLFSPASPAATARVEAPSRDFSRDKPVSKEVFEAYKGLYAYDKGDLNVRVEETETTADWKREKVTFNAAYGNERVIAHVLLPKNVSPPFQAVVFFPGTGAMFVDHFDPSSRQEGVDFVLKSGRALIFPIYKGTYDRRDGLKPGGRPKSVFRDHVIMFSKDMGRSLDYLETRGDIDCSKLSYFGFSWGGALGPVFLAVEKRFKAAILSSGGLPLRYDLPEVDPFTFVPHVTTPVLMLNGRYDSIFPLEASQLPLFRMLGTPSKDKRHVIYEAGHNDLFHREGVGESLDWLDKYLGAVRH